MTIRIRRMTRADLDQVGDIDGKAFTELLSRLRNKTINLPSHEREYFEFWMQCDPGGSLVAEANGKVVGFIFCHAGQRMGWVGPIAVKSGQQGRGIGKSLMLAGMNYFDRIGTKTIGLDTFPENPVSVTLYLKTGFRVVGGLFLLTGKVPSKRRKSSAIRMCAGDLKKASVLDRKASGFARLRDYSFAVSSGLGCGLNLGNDEGSFAFALIRRGGALISNFHLRGQGDINKRVSNLVDGAFDFFRENGFKTAGVLCRGNDSRLLGALLSMGFEMNPVMITMHRGDEFRPGLLTSPFAVEKG